MPPPKFHNIQGNAGTEIPTNLLFFDCESRSGFRKGKREVQTLTWRLGCAIACRIERGKVTRREVLQTTKKEDLFAFIDSRQLARSPLWVFAHNLHFDLTQACFWKELEEGRYSLGPIPGNGADERVRGKKSWRGKLCLEPSPCFLVTMGNTGLVNWVDTSNYWPSALYKIGEKYNLPKGEMPGFCSPNSDWFPYCLRDCEIIEKAIVDLLLRWKKADLGVFQKTSAALSLQSFRHTELKGKHNPKGFVISVNHNEEHSALERESYYGGYTSPFYVGLITHPEDEVPFIPSLTTRDLVPSAIGPLVKIDCNGLYPFCMKRGLYPTKRVKYTHSISPKELAHISQGLGACARVRLDTPEEEYPLRHEEHLQYARGEFWTTLCGAELTRAMRAKHVKQVGEVLLYSLDAIFERWVDYWNTRKHEATVAEDEAEREFSKLIMNSLSGKFAQTSKGWKDAHHREAKELWGQWVEVDADTGKSVTCRGVAGHVQVKQEGEELAHVFPAISAFITASGREYMRDIRALCPQNTVYYQGVDSLILSLSAYAELDRRGLIHESELGKFRVEDCGEEGEIFGNNHYRIERKIVRSGSWGKAKHDKAGMPYAEVWQGIQATLSKKPTGIIEVTRIALEKEQPYLKGVLDKDNWLQFRTLEILPPDMIDEKIVRTKRKAK